MRSFARIQRARLQDLGKLEPALRESRSTHDAPLWHKLRAKRISLTEAIARRRGLLWNRAFGNCAYAVMISAMAEEPQRTPFYGRCYARKTDAFAICHGTDPAGTDRVTAVS